MVDCGWNIVMSVSLEREIWIIFCWIGETVNNWILLAEAIKFYQSKGYQYTEVPWIVEPSVSKITFSSEAISCQLGDLVGSGEQGFLDGDFPFGNFMTVTPCFRHEFPITNTHRNYFMKLELYSESMTDYRDMLCAAYDFFKLYTTPEIVKTSEGHDIMCNGIEIGSYGQRTHGAKTWCYGTGLALPRFTVAQNG